MLNWLSGILTTVLSGWILHDRLLHRIRSWSWHFLNSDISQGSVVTQLRCGEIISQGCVANLLVNLSVKEVWKSVNIWRSYGQYCSALFFFDSQCRCIVSMKGEQEIICTLLNGDIADDLKWPNHPKLPPFLWPPYGIGQAIIFCPVVSFFRSSFLFLA